MSPLTIFVLNPILLSNIIGSNLHTGSQTHLLGYHIIKDQDDGLETIREFLICGQFLGGIGRGIN